MSVFPFFKWKYHAWVLWLKEIHPKCICRTFPSEKNCLFLGQNKSVGNHYLTLSCLGVGLRASLYQFCQQPLPRPHRVCSPRPRSKGVSSIDDSFFRPLFFWHSLTRLFWNIVWLAGLGNLSRKIISLMPGEQTLIHLSFIILANIYQTTSTFLAQIIFQTYCTESVSHRLHSLMTMQLS